MSRYTEKRVYYAIALQERGLNFKRERTGAYLVLKGTELVFVANTYRELRAFIIGYDIAQNRRKD